MEYVQKKTNVLHVLRINQLQYNMHLRRNYDFYSI